MIICQNWAGCVASNPVITMGNMKHEFPEVKEDHTLLWCPSYKTIAMNKQKLDF